MFRLILASVVATLLLVTSAAAEGDDECSIEAVMQTKETEDCFMAISYKYPNAPSDQETACSFLMDMGSCMLSNVDTQCWPTLFESLEGQASYIGQESGIDITQCQFYLDLEAYVDYMDSFYS